METWAHKENGEVICVEDSVVGVGRLKEIMSGNSVQLFYRSGYSVRFGMATSELYANYNKFDEIDPLTKVANSRSIQEIEEENEAYYNRRMGFTHE